MAELKKNTLIVSCLPLSLTDDELRLLFEDVGKIKSCTISRDQAGGESLGFGYVEYVKSYDADLAIDRLNGTQLQDKIIKVAILRQGDNKKKGANLCVTNLPQSYTVEELEALFSAYGSIVQSRILMNLEGVSRGIGFVQFGSIEEAEVAMKAVNGKKLQGSAVALYVNYAEERSKPPPRFQQTQPIYSDAAGYAGGYEYDGTYGGYGVPMTPGILPRGALRPNSRARGGFIRRGVGGGPVRIPLVAARHRYNPVAPEGAYGGASAIPGGANSQGYIVYAYNIGAQTTKDELSDLFSLYGTVTKVDVIWDFQKNMGKGYGFVTMPNYDEALYAIQCLNGYNFAGKPLQVSFKTPKA